MSVNLSIKNVPDEIAEKLRQRAKKAHRSIQGELMSILEQAVTESEQDSLDRLAVQLRALGIKTGDEATGMIRSDRDRL